MAYDRDSFLAGLAVGRTMWRPHRDYSASIFMTFPCFPAGEFIPVEWTYTHSGEVDEAVALNFYTASNLSVWPDPAYWMLWYDTTQGVAEPYKILAFSPDTEYTPKSVNRTMIGLRADDTTFRGPGGAQWFMFHSDSTLGRLRLDSRIPENNVDPLDFFNKWAYFSGTTEDLNLFFQNARLVQTADQLYIAGEIS